MNLQLQRTCCVQSIKPVAHTNSNNNSELHSSPFFNLIKLWVPSLAGIKRGLAVQRRWLATQPAPGSDRSTCHSQTAPRHPLRCKQGHSPTFPGSCSNISQDKVGLGTHSTSKFRSWRAGDAAEYLDSESRHGLSGSVLAAMLGCLFLAAFPQHKRYNKLGVAACSILL